MNNNNNNNNNKNKDCLELNELNNKNDMNGGDNKMYMTKNIIDNLNEEINSFKGDNNEDENKNTINKKYKLLNEEMMKKIKNTLDDNLKIMFNFSYENFLSKESEQESKDYSIENEKFIEH
jgi:hypothetical protein